MRIHRSPSISLLRGDCLASADRDVGAKLKPAQDVLFELVRESNQLVQNKK